MRRLIVLLALPAIVAPLLVACATPVSGPPVTQERQIEDVTAVVLVTSGDLVISIGEPSLTVTAPAEVIDTLTSESGDDLLVLGSTGVKVTPGEIRYELTLPAVTTIRVSGSGDAEIDFSTASEVHVSVDGSGDVDGTGIDASTASISLSGSGDIDLDGTVDGVSARIDGSGDIDVSDLTALDAFVDISGTGEVRVNASRMLKADISGTGTVYYSGEAEVTSDITGTGSVVQDD